MADDCHFEKKSKNHHVSATVRLIATKFGKGRIHDNGYKSENFKIQDGCGRHFEKSKIATSRQRFD